MWQLDNSPRPTRSADELKAMLLQKIKGHPVCPDGMRIEIRSTSGAEWDALASPPEGQNVAYADCVHYISTVARSLRALYDLRLTSVETRAGVGMGWTNSGDDGSPLECLIASKSEVLRARQLAVSASYSELLMRLGRQDRRPEFEYWIAWVFRKCCLQALNQSKLVRGYRTIALERATTTSTQNVR